MTRTYKQIQHKIEALQREAKILRDREIEGVVARIKVAIEHYGLSATQLGFTSGASTERTTSGKASSTSMAKYSDGAGRTWGGRGPRPKWLRDALQSGRSLEEFVQRDAVSAPRKTATGAAKKPKSTVRYQDQAGHSWSGMGPRPRWLKEALAAGRTLEELSR